MEYSLDLWNFPGTSSWYTTQGFPISLHGPLGVDEVGDEVDKQKGRTLVLDTYFFGTLTGVEIGDWSDGVSGPSGAKSDRVESTRV